MNALALPQVLTMTSKEMAEVTEKRHDNVRRTIELLAGQGVISQPQIEDGEKAANGVVERLYRVGKRDSYIIVAQLSPEFTARLVDRWQELESAQAPKLPKTMAQALRLAADQAEQLEAQSIQLLAQQPAVEFVGHYVEAGNDKSFREVAKILGIKERHFFADLAAAKIIFKQGRNWLPFAHHQDAGRFTVKTGVSGDHAYTQTRFTPEGVTWIARRYAKASNDAAFIGAASN